MFENESRSSERMMNALSWIVLITMLALFAVGGMSLVRSWHDGVTPTRIGPSLKSSIASEPKNSVSLSRLTENAIVRFPIGLVAPAGSGL